METGVYILVKNSDIYVQFNIIIIIRQGEFIVHKFISLQLTNHCYL